MHFVTHLHELYGALGRVALGRLDVRRRHLHVLVGHLVMPGRLGVLVIVLAPCGPEGERENRRGNQQSVHGVSFAVRMVLLLAQQYQLASLRHI